jgi:hypothetical protein
MPILRGYTPAHMMGGGYGFPKKMIETKQLMKTPNQKGEALVVDNCDRLKQNRVQLDFGSWAYPTPLTSCDGDTLKYKVPSVGTKVTWIAYSKSQNVSDKIWYKCEITS